MHALQTSVALGLALSLAVGFASCAKEPAPDGPVTTGPPPTVDLHAGHDHAHPSAGPHQGDLIELGNEEYHAEVVHDDQAGTVTVYVLDSAAAKPVPIDAEAISINAKHAGTPEQFQLAASPDQSDPQGKSSRFVSNDPELAEHLDEEDADARLVLTINGKSYRGEIAHDHDHE